MMGRASNALILAILGLFCCPPMALIGLFMSISILADMKRLNIQAPLARSRALIASVLGVIAAIAWLTYLISMAMQAQGR